MLNKKSKFGRSAWSVILLLLVLTLQVTSADSNSNTKSSLERWTDSLDPKNRNIIESNAGKYEPQLLNEFAELKYPSGNQTKSNDAFVRAIVVLKDKSKANNLFSSFSKDELKEAVNRPTSKGIGVKISEKGFFDLVNNENVKKVFFNRRLKFTLSESASLINADDVWDTLGYTGDGVKVCVIDSGANASHPDLQNRITDEKCYNSDNECPDNTNVIINNLNTRNLLIFEVGYL